MHFEAYGATRPQEGRSGNENAFAILRDGPLVAAVADGAGAAGRAAAGVLRRFGRWVVEDGPEALERFPSWERWIGGLDSSILGGGESTFLALAALAGPGPRRGRLVGAWVGDSRAYRIDREGGVELLTDGSSRFRLGSGRVEPRPIHVPVEPGELVLLLTRRRLDPARREPLPSRPAGDGGGAPPPLGGLPGDPRRGLPRRPGGRHDGGGGAGARGPRVVKRAVELRGEPASRARAAAPGRT